MRVTGVSASTIKCSASLMLKKVLKVAGLVVLGVIALAGVAFAYFYFRKPASVPPPDIRVEATAERLARGKHLFEVVANCDQCHSERDPKRFGAPVVSAGRGKGRV